MLRRKVKNRSGRNNRNRKLRLEAMEQRQMMAGDVDLSFGNGWGAAHTEFGAENVLRDMAFQNDGKIIAVGGTNFGGGGYNIAMARYLPDGTLDTSFGGVGVEAGKVVTDISQSTNWAQRAQVLPDAKILVAGIVETPAGEYLPTLTRYEADGTLDVSFGVQGSLVLDTALHSDHAVHALEIEEDQITLVTNQAILRLNMNGSFKSDFGSGGIIAVSDIGGGQVTQIHTADYNGSQFVVGIADDGNNLSVARLHADGSPDITFGEDGFATIAGPQTQSTMRDLVILSDGSILGSHSSNNNASVFKLTEAGLLDPNFHVNGYFEMDDHETINELVLQPDGSIVGVGAIGNDAAALRLSADGVADVNFGINGWVSLGGIGLQANAGLGYANGKVVMGGWHSSGGDQYFFLTRLNMDGAPQFDIPGQLLSQPDSNDRLPAEFNLNSEAAQLSRLRTTATKVGSKTNSPVGTYPTKTKTDQSETKSTFEPDPAAVDLIFEELESGNAKTQLGIGMGIAF